MCPTPSRYPHGHLRALAAPVAQENRASAGLRLLRLALPLLLVVEASAGPRPADDPPPGNAAEDAAEDPAAGQATERDPQALDEEDDDDFGPDLEDLGYAGLSLEELLEIEVEVTTVGRKVQTVHQTPAAVFVLTADDIRRSGATSIPEALRMVPGMQVARANASNWAVSSRGFNGLFATKLLVLIDGRSVYSPLFSGVHWDVQGLLLEDIERIEVVRGPGAALWGANAVNGVINIVTKSAQETQGTSVSSLVGTHERSTSIRHGALFGDTGAIRFYGMGLRRDGLPGDTGGDADDVFDIGQAGVRMDWKPSDTDRMTLQGDLYAGNADTGVRIALEDPPFFVERGQDLDLRGGNLLSRWSRTFSEDEELSLQAYYDHYNRDSELISESRDTVDVDLQHRLRLGRRNEIIWGLGYRGTRGDVKGTPLFHLQPRIRTDHLFSFFVQDELSVHEKLRLILGTKLEHNDYTQFELQPNARVLWLPSEDHTVWAAVSRAVRTPSHVDHGASIGFIVPGTPPTKISVLGNEDFVSEELVAYELGWRNQVSPRLALDLALFYNDYDELTSFEQGEPSFDGTFVNVPLFFDNQLSGETYGLEVAADWRPAGSWRVKTAYSLLRMHLRADESSTGEDAPQVIEGGNPRHQGSLRVGRDIGKDWEIDSALYLVERLTTGDVPGYARLDLRLGWKPRPGIELALVGQGLFHDGEHELAEDFFGTRRDVSTAAYVNLRCTF